MGWVEAQIEAIRNRITGPLWREMWGRGVPSDQLTALPTVPTVVTVP